MTRSVPIQNTFSSGEISPKLWARFDYQRSQTGLRSCNGFVPLRQGALTRAPGTLYTGRARNDAPCMLVPFAFNADDAVVLEFYPNVMRVRRYGDLVMSGGTPYEMAHPYNAAALARLSWVQSADVIYLADGQLPIQRLARLALDNWTIGAQEIDTGPFRLPNVSTSKTVTASASTGTVTLTASFNLFLSGHVGSLLQLEAVDYPDVPIWTQDTAVTAGTTRMRYDGNIYRLTAGTNTGFVPPQHLRGTQKVDQETGATWQYLSDGRGVVRITAVSSPTSATATVLRRLPQVKLTGSTWSVEPTYRWAEGAWSGIYGYPHVLELYDQRFVAARTTSEPRTVWLSAAGGGYADFAQGERPDDAFAVIIDGDGSLNPIQWLRRGNRALHIGALAEEYSLRSDTRNSVVSGVSVRVGKDSQIGCSTDTPISPEGNPIFISRDRARVFEIRYVIEHDANMTQELSLPSDHLGHERFEQIVWQSAPWRIAWLRRASGDLIAMVYDRSEDVLGWSRITLAGGHVESMAVTPTQDAQGEALTLVVRRGNKRFIERMAASPLFPPYELPGTHLFNAALVGPGAQTQTLTVPHLANEISVHIWSDVGAFGPLEADGTGKIVLPVPVIWAHVGLFDPDHEFETLALQPGAQDGSTYGRRQRAGRVQAVGILETEQGQLQWVERDAEAAERRGRLVNLRNLSLGFDRVEPFSGIVAPDLQAGTTRELSLRFKPVSGAKMTVTAIVAALQEMGG